MIRPFVNINWALGQLGISVQCRFNPVNRIKHGFWSQLELDPDPSLLKRLLAFSSSFLAKVLTSGVDYEWIKRFEARPDILTLRIYMALTPTAHKVLNNIQYTIHSQATYLFSRANDLIFYSFFSTVYSPYIIQ